MTAQTSNSRLPIRQGDVLLIPTDEAIPAGARCVKRERGRLVLAHGEATGHAHAIADPDVELYREPGTTGIGDEVDRWLKVQRADGATLRHEEHAPIFLPAGTYKVRRQREYSPEAIRQVAD